MSRVESTRIFARPSAPGRQVLAYQMKVAADAAVAMILPLPVPPGTAEDAVRFISLEAYPKLFDDLDKAFPVSGFAPQPLARGAVPKPAPLVVVKVGAFVASFVPSLADFGRLDARFRVPPGTLDRVPEYADYGFAVFQLDVGGNALTEIHPMAFEFPTRDTGRLFFPTVHVHDGKLPAKAMFAHQLYAQAVDPRRLSWAAGGSLRNIVDPARAAGVVDVELAVHKTAVWGEHPNVDHWVPVG